MIERTAWVSKVNSPTVCVIDDDESVRDSVAALLETRGYVVVTFESALHFLDAIPENAACLLVDMHMPGMTGLELLAVLKAKGFAIPAVLVTADADALRTKARRAGALAALNKPAREEDLFAFVEAAFAKTSKS